jgi:valyl-tRNA synthetase
VTGAQVYIELPGVVDVEAEKIRLQKEIAELEKYAAGIDKKLSNDEFVKNAPEAIVKKEGEKLSEAKEKMEKLKGQLGSLI